MFKRSWSIVLLLAGLMVSWVTPATAGPVQPETGFLRIDRVKDKRVALEIGITTFVREGAPSIELVGVAHIADQAYYNQLQAFLNACDLVLFESVKPAGTGGAGGDTLLEQQSTTTAAASFLAAMAGQYRAVTGALPGDSAVLEAFAAGRDGRTAAFVNDAARDAWGNAFVFLDSPEGAIVRSFGADGAPGGVDAATDLSVPVPSAEELAGDEASSIQGDLATALGLAFQLDVIDYAQPSWVCSDMSIDQVNRAMEEKGLDFSLLEGTLAGSSLPARLVKLLLGVMKFADAFTGGAISDTMKIVLIEMLGNESTLELSLSQLEGFSEVIIDQRNQVVMDDLAAVLPEYGDDQRIAVFYGAGHMSDLAERLNDQLGYEASSTRWLRAIDIDLEASAVTARDVKMVQMMIDRAMKQMKQAAKKR